MKTIKADPEREHNERLRVTAEALIEKGAAPATRLGNLGRETLELLYRRAGNPEFAPDALKLLHELQTHQVEMDLLYEQLRTNEYEMAEELIHYRTLYELAPVAYLIVVNDGQILESNETAGTLLGFLPPQLAGHPVTEFLSLSSHAALAQMFRTLEKPGARAECLAELPAHTLHQDRADNLPISRRLTINARRSAFGDNILMVVSRIPESAPATALP